jgi:hypothetical protein
MSWEYKTLKLGTKGFFGGKVEDTKLEKALNDLGRQDWELVSIFATSQAQGQSRDVVAVLKRRG